MAETINWVEEIDPWTGKAGKSFCHHQDSLRVRVWHGRRDKHSIWRWSLYELDGMYCTGYANTAPQAMRKAELFIKATADSCLV